MQSDHPESYQAFKQSIIHCKWILQVQHELPQTRDQCIVFWYIYERCNLLIQTKPSRFTLPLEERNHLCTSDRRVFPSDGDYNHGLQLSCTDSHLTDASMPLGNQKPQDCPFTLQTCTCLKGSWARENWASTTLGWKLSPLEFSPFKSPRDSSSRWSSRGTISLHGNYQRLVASLLHCSFMN